MFIIPMSFVGTDLTIEKNSQPINQIATGANSNLPFSQVFSDALDNLKETKAQSEQDAYDLSMGNVEDLYKVMINSEKAAAALELTVQLTSRAVNAYKEISQMQV